MRIGILGPLEVLDAAGQPVRLGGPRLRALVIRLALDPGRTIAADRLAGDLAHDIFQGVALEDSVDGQRAGRAKQSAGLSLN